MQIANGTLVLVADGAKLLLFRNDGDAKYPVLVTLAHEEITNPPSRNQGSDAPGRSQSSTSHRRSAYAETDLHRQTQEHFAEHAAEALDRIAAREQGAIVVIAPPRTLGELRNHYSADLKQRLQAEITKDLAGHTTDDIVDVIRDWVP